jgi:hypothetical protein
MPSRTPADIEAKRQRIAKIEGLRRTARTGGFGAPPGDSKVVEIVRRNGFSRGDDSRPTKH